LQQTLIDIFVPGKPAGKKSPKFRRVGKFVSTYADPETVSREAEVRFYAATAYQNGETVRPPYVGAVHIRIEATFPIPTSFSKKKHEAALKHELLPIVTPDCSNICKLVEDAIKGVVIKDDNQVVNITISKRYGTNPGVRMIVVTVESDIEVQDTVLQADKVTDSIKPSI